jgi:3-phenylpropionate/trans-cinnamate dioxygenase ferredoxin subunit
MIDWKKIPEADETACSLLKESDAMTIKIEGARYCIARFEGKYYAMQNNCPHAGASLGAGWCDSKGNIICPVHRMAFDIRTGKNATGSGLYIETYPVEVRKDGLYIGFKKKRWWQIF